MKKSNITKVVCMHYWFKGKVSICLASPRQKNSFIDKIRQDYHYTVTLKCSYGCNESCSDIENCAALTFVAVPRLAE